jgi:hypothetical protein
MAAPATVTRPQASRLGARPPPPPLESGDRLGAAEFLRRYEEMPRIKKAELIEGIVCREYVPNMPDDRGVLRGPHFPGLALAVNALLAHDSARELDILRSSLQEAPHAAFAAQLAAKMKAQG